MNKSIIKKYRFFCILSGIIMGCVFPVFTQFFMAPKSELSGKIFIIACILAGITVGILSFLLGNFLVIKTILQFNKSFERMSLGDFTHKCTIESSDSIGELVSNLGIMNESLKGLIQTVREKAMSIDDVTIQYQIVLDEHMAKVRQVLTSAKEVSNDMINITEDLKILDQSFYDIIYAVKTIAKKASNGALKSTEISNKANIAKIEIEKSIKKTDEMLEHTTAKMHKTIGEMGVLDTINSLLNSIIKISSQTNMLALNASIESNRADKNNRGFSIIAAEIRRLSDESKENTEKITIVMEKFNSSAGALLTDIKILLQFIETNVKQDYISFKKVIAEYDDNSKFIKEMVDDFSNQSEEVFDTTQIVLDRMNAIASLSGNSMVRAGDILDEVKLLNEGSMIWALETNKLRGDSQSLKSLVEKFKL